MHREKYSNINCALCRVVNPSKKVPDFNCELQDLSTEVVNLKNEVPDPVVKVVMCSRGGGSASEVETQKNIDSVLHTKTFQAHSIFSVSIQK